MDAPGIADTEPGGTFNPSGEADVEPSDPAAPTVNGTPTPNALLDGMPNLIGGLDENPVVAAETPALEGPPNPNEVLDGGLKPD